MLIPPCPHGCDPDLCTHCQLILERDFLVDQVNKTIGDHLADFLSWLEEEWPLEVKNMKSYIDEYLDKGSRHVG